jgi:hypothetical protein
VDSAYQARPFIGCNSSYGKRCQPVVVQQMAMYYIEILLHYVDPQVSDLSPGCQGAHLSVEIESSGQRKFSFQEFFLQRPTPDRSECHVVPSAHLPLREARGRLRHARPPHVADQVQNSVVSGLI